MRDEDKPFICVKRGWSMNIKPRNAEGRRQLGLWMLVQVPIVLLFIGVMRSHPHGALLAVYVMFFVAALLVWTINMVRWMMARSEIIDLTGKPWQR